MRIGKMGDDSFTLSSERSVQQPGQHQLACEGIAAAYSYLMTNMLWQVNGWLSHGLGRAGYPRLQALLERGLPAKALFQVRKNRRMHGLFTDK
ncbi:hypothetical protein [Pseudomonas sp. DWP3-1-2]|uniref:hypothetical protein n=1 Tax=Pseudomonas sp. DWP3-1-2 TaxID=2804645 RepID=UPI003CF43314